MCDTLCLFGDGGAVFAKNSDRPVREPQVVERAPSRPTGGVVRTQYLELPDSGAQATVLSRPTWLWGAEHGVNAKRVAIGNEKIWSVDDPRRAPPALIGMDLVRLALEQAYDATHAVDIVTSLLERYGQGGIADAADDEPYWSSFLVVDPNRGWIVETSDRTWVAAPIPPRGGAISNRLCLRHEWTRSSPDVAPGADFDTWRPEGESTGHADRRLAASRAFVDGACGDAPAFSPLRRADLDVAAVAAHLRDHGTGPWGAPCGDPGPAVATGAAARKAPVAPPTTVEPDGTGVTVCMHIRGYQATSASMVAELPADPAAPTRAWAALGSPCASVYVPVLVPDHVPAVLGDPATWTRFAAVRDAVEADASRLDAVRGVLAPVEDRLWAAAFDAGRDQAQWERLTAEATVAVRTALDDLDALGVTATGADLRRR